MSTDTRQTILRHLLAHKDEGLTIDELAQRLDVSRNAVQQHLSGLERDGLLEVAGRRSTGGRPSRAYTLSEKGLESFPRHYALLAEHLLEAARDTLGEAAVEQLLLRMAEDLAGDLAGRVRGEGAAARIDSVVALMNELGYDAAPISDGEGIAAVNCVYHKLARRTRAVCRYDVKLLSQLLGGELEHRSCMADGERSCVFRLKTEG